MIIQIMSQANIQNIFFNLRSAAGQYDVRHSLESPTVLRNTDDVRYHILAFSKFE